MFPKPKERKHKRNGIPKQLIAEVKKRSGGICEYCHSRASSPYPHHMNERGMGGGRGLDILINMLDVDGICHNHDDTEFLKWCDEELERRIDQEFSYYDLYSFKAIAERLHMNIDEVKRQYTKGFLHAGLHQTSKGLCLASNKEQIKRWLTGSKVKGDKTA